MPSEKFLSYVLIFLIGISFVAFADSITTSVRFIIPSSIGFAIAVPSNGSFVTSGSTATLVFNTTATTAVRLNATLLGAAAGTNSQNSTQSIFRYRNDGNAAIDINATFGGSPTCSGGTITVKAGNESGSWQTSCTKTTGPPNGTQCVNITTSAMKVVSSLAVSGTSDLWLWADFTTCAAALDTSQTLTHTSGVA